MMRSVGKRILSILCVICMMATLFSSVVMADGTVTVTLNATSYKTDGVIVPSITGLTGEVTYRYLMAESATAPIEYWEEIVYDNTNLSASGTITDVGAASDEAYLLLSAKQAGMYVKMEITQGDNVYYSAVTPKITYTPNMLNNGEMNTVGVNATTNEVYGWTEGVYDSSKSALKSSGAVNGSNWYNKFTFPMDVSKGSYVFTVTAARTNAGGLNYRAMYNDTVNNNDMGNGKWKGGNSGTFLTDSYIHTYTKEPVRAIAFRVCTSSSAGAEIFWMKDISLAKQAPYVKNLSISGDMNVWGNVTADHIYVSDNDADVKDANGAVTGKVAEGETVVKWFASANQYGPWTELSVAGKTVNLPEEAMNKYIKAEITPVNANGVSGDTQFIISDTTVGAGKGIAICAVDGKYQTDGILYPKYIYTGQGEEGTSTYRYLMADKADAPSSAWTEVSYSNDEITVGNEITMAKAKNAYLLLSQEMVGKYIRIEITPKDKEGNAYAPILSDPTPMIEYSPNLFNNPTFSREAIDADGNVMGWSNSDGNAVTLVDDKDGVTASGALAIRPAADEAGYDFRTKMILPAKFVTYGLKYNIDYDVYKITGGNTNYRMKFGNNAMLSVMGGNNTHNNKWTDVIGVYESNAGNANSGNIGFAMSGSAGGAAGQFNVDNVSITEVAPYASNVRILGTLETGKTLTAVYNYNNEFDGKITESVTGEDGTVTETSRDAVEKDSVITWYMSDNNYGPWEKIGTGLNLKLEDECANKYLRVTVKASSENGIASPIAIPSFNDYLVALGEVVEPDEPSDLPAFDEGDPFKAYISEDAVAPQITDVYESEVIDGVTVEKFRFKLRDYVHEGQTKTALIYTIMAYPTENEGNLPGIVYLHGGGGSADSSKSAIVEWAKRGYVVIAPDVPCAYNKAEDVVDLSEGLWKTYGYANGRYSDDVTSTTTFDGALAGVQAYHILAAQEMVNVDKIGTTGTSWGGWNTTMLSGLLGDRIKATYSRYTGGFFDIASSFSVAKNYPTWLKYVDAGRRAGNMTSNYFIMAAAKDTFMYPPTINASFDAIGSENKNITFAPNGSHSPSGITGGNDMDYLWMDYYLKGEGTAFPKVTEMSSEVDLDAFTRKLTIRVSSELPVTSVKVYYSTPDVAWTERTWNSFEATKATEGIYEATLTSAMLEDSVDYYVVATDGTASGGTTIYSSRDGINALTLKNFNITATSLKTDGVVVPSYEIDSEASMGAVEGKSNYRWLMADTADAPISAWEEIDISHTRRSTPATITAGTAEKIYLNLGPSQRSKYVKLEVTPVDSAGNVGEATYSNVIGPIEYTTNLINNGDFGTNVNFGSFSGTITDGVLFNPGYTKSMATGNTSPRIWLTEKLEFGTYRATATMKTATLNDAATTTKAQLFFESTTAPWRSVAANINSNDWTTVDGYYAVTQNTSTPDATKAENVQIGFRVFGGDFASTQADYYAKNYTLKRVAPYAKNVVVTGDAKAGSKLTASYDYVKEDDVYNNVTPDEGVSIYKWYIADNAYGPWTLLSNTTKELTVGSKMEGKFVRFEVTPVNNLESPRSGYSQVSNTVAIEKGDITVDFANITGSIAANSTISAAVQMTNNVTRNLYPAILLVSFKKDENGNRIVDKVSVDTESATNGHLQTETNDLYEASITLGEDVTGVEVELFIWGSVDSAVPLIEQVIVK